MTPAATRLADQTWLTRHSDGFNVVIADMTSSEGVLAVMGPNSRTLLQRAASSNLDNSANPFGTAKWIEIAAAPARAHRISYVGELGWEIYISSDMAAYAFERIWEAGADLGLKLCGMHMMDSCRSEKAFRHFGHDITCEDHVLEAGLGFAVGTHKKSFVGREAVLRKRDEGIRRRMLQFKLNDPLPLLYHNEPILRDGEIVGHLTSGSYGHALKGAVGLGYVPCKGESSAQVLNSSFEIEVAGARIPATASAKPMYDPTGARPKA